MVAPNGSVRDVVYRHLGLRCRLSHQAVLIKTQHGGEVFWLEIRSALHGDPGIGVAGVADHEHLAVARGGFVERTALSDKNLSIGIKQISALHPFGARAGADKQRDIGVAEGGRRFGGIFQSGKQRKGAVIKLHHDALHLLLAFRGCAVKQLQNNGLVGPEHVAGGDAEKERIADVAGWSGNGNADGFLHGQIFFSKLNGRQGPGLLFHRAKSSNYHHQ